MEAEHPSLSEPDTRQHSNARSLTDRELATAAGGLVAGALLLRMQPVRSLLKLGALGAAGWAAWHYAGRWTAAAAARDGGANDHDDELSASSQRLADAWGARYHSPTRDIEPVGATE